MVLLTAIRRLVLSVVPVVVLVAGLLAALAVSGALAGAGPASLAGSSLARASISATSSAGSSLAVAGAAGMSVHTGPPPGAPSAAVLSTVFTSAVSGRPVTTLATDKGCMSEWWVMGDGVRIHTRPSLRAPVLGLGYTVDQVDILDSRPGWLKISDNHGIITTGWMARRFLEPFPYCPADYILRAPHGVI